MKNNELIAFAIKSGFDCERTARVYHSSGEAVSLPKNIKALERLEKLVPTLESVADTFHYWLVRA